MADAHTPRPAGRRRRILRRLGLMALVLGLAMAWVWQRTLPLKAVAVVDAVHADAADVVRLTGARPDSVAVFSLSPALMADRAQRHPWVRRAYVRRLPSATLRVRVEERVPVALVMDGGAPSHFLDAEGYAMPLRGAAPALYDVPVLTGRLPAYHPTRRVESASLRELLRALATADATASALVSEIDWQPRRLTLWTTPAGGHASIPVRLAPTGFTDQLERLRAFWDQSVLPRPATPFRSVDLRFRGQIVSREGAAPLSPPPAPAAGDSSAAR
jgi:cell division protein FtsQ